MKKAFRSIYRVVNAFIDKFNEHKIGAYSAQASFFIVISIFPFLMLLTAIVQQLSFSTEELFGFFRTFFPKNFSSLIENIISEVPSISSGALISITAITALWSSSRGVYSIVLGLNSVCEAKETRGYFKTRLISLFYTFALLIIMVCLLVLLVFGNTLYETVIHTFPSVQNSAFIIISLRFIIALGALTVFFTAMYKFLPNRKAKLLYQFPGAAAASIGWIIFSYIYSLYADRATAVGSFYGSLTTFVFFMLWLYFCMYIVFFGAELNNMLAEYTSKPETAPDKKDNK